ncbi:acireductone synthase [Leptospira sp. GIMC2001]|uniref:acireductone synthase n=1 Tax=Leptospira sp. GIMC2001 TaxID=1513297 RepID=UPI00234BD27D|nr:acireductone synthase [Leptospira sp. GIMC2001]WCL48532.1 acireductone synthase [Leptospira sp. GIMC2001]
MPNVCLLDIEGTVGSISFVHNVLFPYSTERLLGFLREYPIETELLQEILLENERDYSNGEFPKIENPSDPREINAYLQFLTRIDRKFSPLKIIQGRIWKLGFEIGDLKAELFEDVPKVIEACSKKNWKFYIYSSGSVEAQILFFQYSIFGDLTQYISGYFDTEVGAKRDKNSYLTIRKRINDDFIKQDLVSKSETDNNNSEFIFLTDIKEEAYAAEEAGWNVAILNRPGNYDQGQHNLQIFDNLFPLLEKTR